MNQYFEASPKVNRSLIPCDIFVHGLLHELQ